MAAAPKQSAAQTGIITFSIGIRERNRTPYQKFWRLPQAQLNLRFLLLILWRFCWQTIHKTVKVYQLNYPYIFWGRILPTLSMLFIHLPLIGLPNWSEWGDSNTRSYRPKRYALPTALHPDKLRRGKPRGWGSLLLLWAFMNRKKPRGLAERAGLEPTMHESKSCVLPITPPLNINK